jgi:putative acetyltransferase
VSAAVTIEEARSAEQVEQVREMFKEYAASIGFSLSFQNFDQELAELPGDYSRPNGCLLLAYVEDQARAAGCVALHRFENDICEMKRLYVRPEFRGRNIGRLLAKRVIDMARTSGYARMRLDTVSAVMQEAVALYRTLGFREIPAYRQNPMSSALYMELELSVDSAGA